MKESLTKVSAVIVKFSKPLARLRLAKPRHAPARRRNYFPMIRLAVYLGKFAPAQLSQAIIIHLAGNVIERVP